MEKDEFLQQYRNITSNLRKRFLKRPNVTEAIDSYGSLSKQQSNHGFGELGAACHIASATLEQAISLSSHGAMKTEENVYFLDAARLYSDPDIVQSESATLSAVNCYVAAINASQDSANSFSLALEAGSTFLRNGEVSSATEFFTKAMSLAKNDTTLLLAATRLLVHTLLLQKSFFKAFQVALKASDSNPSWKLTIMLLGVLLKRQRSTQGSSALSQNVETILNTPVSVPPEEFQMAVDSILLSVNDDVLNVPDFIWQYLSNEQKQILLLLTDVI